MKVNKIATMYKYSDRVNFFGVPIPNPLSAKQDLYRRCVLYPNKGGTFNHSPYTINYRFEYKDIAEVEKFGNIPLGVI